MKGQFFNIFRCSGSANTILNMKITLSFKFSIKIFYFVDTFWRVKKL